MWPNLVSKTPPQPRLHRIVNPSPLTAWLDLKTILVCPVGVLIFSGKVRPHFLSPTETQLKSLLIQMQLLKHIILVRLLIPCLNHHIITFTFIWSFNIESPSKLNHRMIARVWLNFPDALCAIGVLGWARIPGRTYCTFLRYSTLCFISSVWHSPGHAVIHHIHLCVLRPKSWTLHCCFADQQQTLSGQCETLTLGLAVGSCHNLTKELGSLGKVRFLWWRCQLRMHFQAQMTLLWSRESYWSK